jgi:hypothetical protein
LILHAYTIIHTLISLAAIFTGFVVLFGLFGGKRFDGWTKWFLITAVATTVTVSSFRFMVSPRLSSASYRCLLALTIFVRYPKQLAGPWRWIFVVGAIICLYLNVFVAVVQAFQKVPSLKTLAPTQTEPPFAVTQLTALLLFVLSAIAAAIRFRPVPVRVR